MNIPITTTFSWAPSTNTMDYYVWPFSDYTGETSYTPPAALLANTRYTWRIDSYNSEWECTQGVEWTFTTTTAKPTVQTGTATNNATDSATLNAIINPNGLKHHTILSGAQPSPMATARL